MNNKISPEAFFDEFSGQSASPSKESSWINKNTLRAFALTAAVVLSGCATTGTAYNAVEANNNHLASQGHEIVQLKEINSENYKDILGNHESGVYKDPYETENIVTFEFYQDKNAEEAILEDMHNHGLDADSYHWQRNLIDISNEATGRSQEMIDQYISQGNFSRHAQDPFGIGDDINLSMLDNDHRGFGVRDLLDDYPQFADYSNYLVAMHEVAHGFDHQQMNFLDFGIAAFSKEKVIEMENSSDFAAMIMTLQLMDDNKEPIENMNVFLDSIINERQSGEHGHFAKDGEDGVAHATSITLKVVKQMLNENPEHILGMEKPDIVKSAELVSSMVIEHDFTDEVVMDLIASKGDVINDSVHHLELLQDKMENDYEGFRKQVDTINSKFSDKPVIGDMFKFIDENESDFQHYSKHELKELMIDILSKEVKGEDGLNIVMKETQGKLAKYDVDNFPILGDKVLQEMNKRGIVDLGVEVASETTHEVEYGHDEEMGFKY